MKLSAPSLLFWATMMLGIACKHPQYAADKLPQNQIRWGTGGGFVGKESSHILCDNGQIFSRDIVGNTQAAGKTKRKHAASLYKTIKSLDLAKMEFNHPGNTYSFLEYQEGDMKSRVVWGDKNAPVGKPVEEAFRALNALLVKK